MKLFHAVASPFARKVRIAAAERGLALDLVAAAVTPVKPDPTVKAMNPSGKIPTLLADDGTALYDSRVIVEYLDSLGDAPKLIPAAGKARWKALTLQSLADEMLDAAVLGRYETFLRPADKRWDEWIAGIHGKIDDSLKALAAETAHLSGPVDIGVIAAACALGYLDFRYPDKNWRAAHPGLAGWYAGFAERPSMKATVPA